MKRCTRCGVEKPLTDFYRMKAASDGRKSECKVCSDARPRPKSRRAYAFDRERWNRRRRDRRRQQREQANAAKRRNWARHRTRLSAARRLRYATDPAYRLRALMRRPGRRIVGADRVYAAVLWHDPCAYCGAPGGQVDHIVAIAAGGGHEWENLTAACASCNARKWAKPLLAFLLDG